MKFKFILLIFICALVFSSTYVFARVPPVINYQGKLTNPSGAPVNGTLQMVFTVYSDTGGITPLWTETQAAVVIDKGVFNVLLGSVDSIPYSVFDGSIRYLGVKVGDDPEITPRKPLVSVGYAFHSGTAHKMTFDYNSGWVQAAPNNTYTFFHNLGGNPDDYIVFLDGKSSDGRIHHCNYGTNMQYNKGDSQMGKDVWIVGCEWFGLTSTEIKVYRGEDDAGVETYRAWDKLRIRIIKNQ